MPQNPTPSTPQAELEKVASEGGAVPTVSSKGLQAAFAALGCNLGDAQLAVLLQEKEEVVAKGEASVQVRPCMPLARCLLVDCWFFWLVGWAIKSVSAWMTVRHG